MGPCQGGFCTFRIAGILNQLRHNSILETNAMVCDFLQERWKGLIPILWGSQLRQERLNELIYLNILNINHLPGDKHTDLHSDSYLPPTGLVETIKNGLHIDTEQMKPDPITYDSRSDVLIIGAGWIILCLAICGTIKEPPHLFGRGQLIGDRLY
jgi:hypothetical protein